MAFRVGKYTLLTTTALVLVAGAVGGGVLIGRATARTHEARQSGYRAGLSAGYFQGLPVGEAQGRREGRVLAEGTALPAGDRAPVTHAFNDGYAAGANDVFAGYDGGWSLSMPYVVVVTQASGDITYRIESRVPIERGVTYYLCPDGHTLCQRPLR